MAIPKAETAKIAVKRRCMTGRLNIPTRAKLFGNAAVVANLPRKKAGKQNNRP